MAATKNTKAKAAEATGTETVETVDAGTVEQGTVAKAPARTGRMLMEVVTELPPATETRGGGAAFADAFRDIKERTESGELFAEGADEPSWVAVKEYGNASGARNHIKDMLGAGKNGNGQRKGYAIGFEFADRKFKHTDGTQTSILYARYTGE